jgi:DNA-directed RNA polymerase alpha subunit
MAVKKSKPAEDKATKAPATKIATKPKAAKAKAEKPAVASVTASKAETPKAAVAPKKAAAAPKKAAAPVKLTERQLEFLKQIHGASAEGFITAKKAEQKTLDTLLDKKLIKKGAKDKASGNFRYTVSKAGEKHLSSTSAS